MSKFYIDTEFIERFHKPFFDKKRHVIDLISIGIVAENGKEYHAISNEYRYKDASLWVKENVIHPLYKQTVSCSQRQFLYESDFHKRYGKSNEEISKEIRSFVYKESNSLDNIQFIGYYADYDWVLLCSLFGTMINLPAKFPMYCYDLKQLMDEKGLTKEWKNKTCPEPENGHDALADARWNMKFHQEISKAY